MRTRRSYLLRNSSTLNSYYHFQNSLCTSNLILSISCLWWQQLGTCRHLIATWILLMFPWKDSTSIGSLRKSKMNNNLLEKHWIHCSWKLHHPFIHLRLFLSMIALVVLFLFQLSLMELSDFSALELPWEVMTVDCSEFLELVNQKKMQMQSTACFTWPKTGLLFYNICRLLSTKNFLWWDRSWRPFVTFKLRWSKYRMLTGIRSLNKLRPFVTLYTRCAIVISCSSLDSRSIWISIRSPRCWLFPTPTSNHTGHFFAYRSNLLNRIPALFDKYIPISLLDRSSLEQVLNVVQDIQNKATDRPTLAIPYQETLSHYEARLF